LLLLFIRNLSLTSTPGNIFHSYVWFYLKAFYIFARAKTDLFGREQMITQPSLFSSTQMEILKPRKANSF